MAQLRLGEFELSISLISRDHKITRIDHHQHIALMYKLVVEDRKRDDAACNLRRHRDEIGTHCAVPGPWRCHVGLPHAPGERTGERKRDQRDQDGNSAQRRPRCIPSISGAVFCHAGMDAILYTELYVRHQPDVPAMKTRDDRMIV